MCMYVLRVRVRLRVNQIDRAVGTGRYHGSGLFGVDADRKYNAMVINQQ